MNEILFYLHVFGSFLSVVSKLVDLWQKLKSKTR
jgi:hypothetical protein